MACRAEYEATLSICMFSGFEVLRGKYFILWDIVDPRTESNPNPNPNPEPNHKPNHKPNPNHFPEPNPNPNPEPNPNPNPDPNCGFTISHKMKYLRLQGTNMIATFARSSNSDS